MKTSGMSHYGRTLLMFTVPSLLLAMIGVGLAWLVLDSRVLLWLQAIVPRSIWIFGLLAFAGLACGQRLTHPRRDYLPDRRLPPDAGHVNLVVVMIAFVIIIVACAFILYLPELSERALLEIANLLLVSGLGAFVMFAASALYLAVIGALLHRRDHR